MADFLVLEEDGTSHLELEESSSDFLLEDGGVIQAKAGFGEAGLTTTGATPPPPTSRATWQTGTITVPSGTGSMAITGLGDTPAAVFFYGTNWTTWDTAVTTQGNGMFRGMAAPDYASPGTIVNNFAACAPAGDWHWIDNYALGMVNATATVNLFYASVTSFDGDGFTLNWLNASAGGYEVVWVALMDVTSVGSYRGSASTISLGFKAGAALMHGAWAGPVAFATTQSQEFYGGAAFRTTNSANWMGAGLSAFTFPTSASAQFNIGLFDFAPTASVAQGGEFIGPFLAPGNETLSLSGTGQTSMGVGFTNANAGMVTAWDDEDSFTGRLMPATSTGGTVTVSGLPFAPGLVLGYSIGDEPATQGTGGRGAIGFTVATPDFQWCALADGFSSVGSFQSYNRGFCDAISGTSYHAGTIEFTADGFILTTEEDDVSPSSWVWHAFGHPEQFPVWIPQSYRRRN